jgi:hypothetical protein
LAEPSLKSKAWALFDAIVESAPFKDLNPWELAVGGRVAYVPDFETLGLLLGVPLHLGANSQSGVPALALDIWTAYELRRAGFEPDRVWPRATSPRVLPIDVATFVESLPVKLKTEVKARLADGKSGGTASASANLLGKNYVKQVDVVMSSWQTGPELMISTKRMDSSFGKNAANRVEESYGDAKNLSLRHPQAALGFLYGLRSTAFTEEPDTAAWLVDLLSKLGREDDAYDAVGLLVLEYSDAGKADQGEPEEAAPLELEEALVAVEDDVPEVTASESEVSQLPTVNLLHDLVPAELSPARFLEIMVRTVLGNSPINFHRQARAQLLNPRA